VRTNLVKSRTPKREWRVWERDEDDVDVRKSAWWRRSWIADGF
jgi:hypothetical protein